MDRGGVPVRLLLHVQSAGLFRQQLISDLLQERDRRHHRPAAIRHSLGTFYCHDNQLAMPHLCNRDGGVVVVGGGGFMLRPTASCSTPAQAYPCILLNSICLF